MQRQKFASLIRVSGVLSLSLLVVMLGGLLKPEASVQPVSFGAKTDFVTGMSPVSVAVGDFNRDGKLDLVVANQFGDTVSILLGTGTGSFGANTDFGTGSQSVSVAVGDFNGDGKLDLAVANENSATVSILLGTGTGSFGANTDFGTGRTAESVAVGDFNGDGKLDLAVANFSSATVSILLNACNANTPPTITCPSNVQAAATSGCPIATSGAVTFPAPTPSDDSPGVTVLCNPPSGSTFPVGDTTVTCTGTDSGGLTAQCTFTVSLFSFCLQDESNPGNVVLVNAQTGDFSFCCDGVPIASGRGDLTTRGCIGSIDSSKGDRQVHIQWDTSANSGLGAGTAYVQKRSNKIVCQITDGNMSNNTCQCSSPPPPMNPRRLLKKAMTQKHSGAIPPTQLVVRSYSAYRDTGRGSRIPPTQLVDRSYPGFDQLESESERRVRLGMNEPPTAVVGLPAWRADLVDERNVSVNQNCRQHSTIHIRHSPRSVQESLIGAIIESNDTS